jgi:hypothetical protein
VMAAALATRLIVAAALATRLEEYLASRGSCHCH